MTELFPDERTQFRNWQWIARFFSPGTLWVTMYVLAKSRQHNILSSHYRLSSFYHVLNQCFRAGMCRYSNYPTFLNHHVYDGCPMWRDFNPSINGVPFEKINL